MGKRGKGSEPATQSHSGPKQNDSPECFVTELQRRVKPLIDLIQELRMVSASLFSTFQLAEVAVSGDLFHRILTAIHGLRVPPAST